MRSRKIFKAPAAVPLVAVAATLALLSACSSGSSSSAAGTGNSASSGGSSSAGSIKIMLTASLSSSTFSVPQVLSGAQAAVSAINASGGVNGKSIDLISCNDQSDANQAQQCAQKAVTDHVSAVTGFFLFGPQLYDATKAAGIPVIDTQPVVPQSGTESNSYPIDAGGFSEFYGVGKGLVERGDKNVAIIQINLAASQFNAGIAASGVKAAGGTVVRTVTAQGGAPDYAPYVQQALGSGNVQAIIFVGGTEDAPKVVTAASQAGFKGDIGTTIGNMPQAAIDQLKASKSTAHVYVASNFYVPPSSQAQQFVSDMGKYQPSAVKDVFSEGAWAAIYAIKAALTGKSSTDAKSLTAALSSAKALDLGTSAFPSIDMSKPGPISGYPRLFNPDAVLYQVKNGQLKSVGGTFNPYVSPAS